jgi:hypothetical protein
MLLNRKEDILHFTQRWTGERMEDGILCVFGVQSQEGAA